jgi:hypothetical protein
MTREQGYSSHQVRYPRFARSNCLLPAACLLFCSFSQLVCLSWCTLSALSARERGFSYSLVSPRHAKTTRIACLAGGRQGRETAESEAGVEARMSARCRLRPARSLCVRSQSRPLRQLREINITSLARRPSTSTANNILVHPLAARRKELTDYRAFDISQRHLSFARHIWQDFVEDNRRCGFLNESHIEPRRRRPRRRRASCRSATSLSCLLSCHNRTQPLLQPRPISAPASRQPSHMLKIFPRPILSPISFLLT